MEAGLSGKKQTSWRKPNGNRLVFPTETITRFVTEWITSIGNRRAILFLGSARGSRAGERVLAIANFSVVFNAPDVAMHKGRPFRGDAETSTRAACAPQISQRQRTGLPLASRT